MRYKMLVLTFPDISDREIVPLSIVQGVKIKVQIQIIFKL